ncbi:MAG: gliding motility protein GldM [Bacteroidota bacterium]
MLPKIKVDSLALFDIPTSRVVAAGMKFETTLAVAMFDSELRPEFIGSGVRTNPGGTSATLSMTAPGGFPAGQHQKEVSFAATVELPAADGDIVDLQLQGKYTVVKPEAVFESKSVQNLYFQCGNTFSLDVPLLGEYYSPKFAASDAEVINNVADKRTVTVVPKGKTCVVALSSLTNGQSIKIDDLTFRVIAPPLPKIRLMVDGKEWDGLNQINGQSEVVLKVIPDDDFRSGLPFDARYTIDQIEILAQKTNGGTLTKVGSVACNGKDAWNGIPISLGNMLKDVSSGSQCYLKIGNVNRINFQNRQIEEKFDAREKVIRFVLK